MVFFAGRQSDAEPKGCTLEQTCAVLNLDVDRVRGQAWRVCTKGFRVPIRRRCLSAAVRRQILDGLAKGASSTQLGKQYGINPATVRKIRSRPRSGPPR